MGTAAGNKRLRQNRRAKGLCGTLGCKRKSLTYYCDPCGEAHAARMALARQKAKAA